MGKPRYDTRNIFFEVWEKDLGQWIPTKFTARCFEYETRLYKLFRIGTLSRVLSRSVGWIQQLERDGKFPKTLFEVDGCHSRYYSEDQIRMSSFFQRQILGDNPDKLRGPGLNMDAYYKAVRDNWGVINFDPDDYEIQHTPTGRNDVIFE